MSKPDVTVNYDDLESEFVCDDCHNPVGWDDVQFCDACGSELCPGCFTDHDDCEGWEA